MRLIPQWQARMGWTDRQAAAELGISQGSYSKIKGGHTPTSRRTLLACEALAAGLAPVADVVGWQARMGWTDRVASAQLGISQGSYSKIKGGHTSASVRTLLACAALEHGGAGLA